MEEENLVGTHAEEHGSALVAGQRHIGGVIGEAHLALLLVGAVVERHTRIFRGLGDDGVAGRLHPEVVALKLVGTGILRQEDHLAILDLALHPRSGIARVLDIEVVAHGCSERHLTHGADLLRHGVHLRGLQGEDLGLHAIGQLSRLLVERLHAGETVAVADPLAKTVGQAEHVCRIARILEVLLFLHGEDAVLEREIYIAVGLAIDRVGNPSVGAFVQARHLVP